jgi:carbon monoxide dehydrogenase subunit G
MKVVAKAKAAVPVHQAWPKLADLKALPEWAPDVASCKAETLRLGARRVATLRRPAGGKSDLVETVMALRPQGFTYDIEGGIGPFTSIVTSWDLEPRGEGCTVVVSSDLEVGGRWRYAKPLAAWAWKRQLKALAKGFARYAERA